MPKQMQANWFCSVGPALAGVRGGKQMKALLNKQARKLQMNLKRESNMRSILISGTIILSVATAAQADIVGSAPAFGESSQTVAVCYYVNGGGGSVTFNSSQIFAEPNTPVAEASETCAGAFGPNARCRTVASIANNVAHWCRADVSNKRAIRGRLEIRSSFGINATEKVR